MRSIDFHCMVTDDGRYFFRVMIRYSLHTVLEFDKCRDAISLRGEICHRGDTRFPISH